MLGDILPAEAFGFLLVTVRMAALVMIMPVLGDHSVPARMRVAFAMMVSIIVYGTVRTQLPPMPGNIFDLAALMIRELTIGLMMGLVTRILLTSTHVAGSLIAFQTGLAAAQSFDPSQGSQSVIVATFMTLIAVTLITVTDLHHLLIMGMANSYVRFPAGMALPVADFATVTVRYVSSSFMLGSQMALPFIVFGIVYNVGLGLVARMVQGFQVFFIGMPINLFLGFTLIMLLMGSMMNLFLDQFRVLLLDFVG
ncbi:MAG: flagellar biosynthetic protein FliR [Alphaproteobacteria bacterium]|nr:MAG: flagellar biosynthetic protein FliR [Alphaproteobacteria bacterium]